MEATGGYEQRALAQLSEQGVPVAGTNQITYNGSNQVLTANVHWGQTNLSESYSYDAAGNVTNDGLNQYAYDAEGRLCAVQNTVTKASTQYLYDAEGRRVGKGSQLTPTTPPTCPAPTSTNFKLNSQYLLDQGGDQVTELNGTLTNGTYGWVHSNVWPGGHLDATYDVNGLHFHFADPLGSRRVQTSAIGLIEENIQSLPFGNGLVEIIPPTAPATADDATEHHFTGKERDTESGNDYFGARYYASTMGRFLSPDWSSKEEPVPYAKLDNPQSLNLYDYMRNNPLGGTDPDGHGPNDWWDARYWGIRAFGWVVGEWALHEVKVTAEHRQELTDRGVVLTDGKTITDPAHMTAGQVNSAYNQLQADDFRQARGQASQILALAATAPILGANGTQVTSKTLWEDGKEHIDVENPNPGQRPGQIHYQDAANNKYIYNVGTGQFEGLSNSQSKQLLSNPEVQQAIQKGLKYLGVSQ